MDNDKKIILFGKKMRRWEVILLFLIALVFLTGLCFLALTYRSFRRQVPPSPESVRSFHRRPLAVGNIEGWMTFGFINRSFNLPPKYLKDALGVTDPKYPNVTLNRWAKESEASAADLLEEVRLLVRNYKSTAPAVDTKNI